MAGHHGFPQVDCRVHTVFRARAVLSTSAYSHFPETMLGGRRNLGCDQSSRSLADKRASQRSKPSAHILSHPPTTVRRSLERGKLALNLVTSALRSSSPYNWHDLHSTTMIWPLRDLSVATSGNCGIRHAIACVLRPPNFVLVAHSLLIRSLPPSDLNCVGGSGRNYAGG